jgi:hypothetical protein
MELASVCRRTHRPKVPQFCCDRGAGPIVRIHFPPAESQANHRFLGDAVRLAVKSGARWGIGSTPLPLGYSAAGSTATR